jgi:hypothetical protein
MYWSKLFEPEVVGSNEKILFFKFFSPSSAVL